MYISCITAQRELVGQGPPYWEPHFSDCVVERAPSENVKARITNKCRFTDIAIVMTVVIGVPVFFKFGRNLWEPAVQKISGQDTVADVIRRYGPGAMDRMQPHFEQAGVDYPPSEVVLLAMKEEKALEVWAKTTESVCHVHTYKILGTSGGSGPKLREGDGQVPEGVYKIIGLNPNSAYHLSMKLNYPNAFDFENAQKEGRTEPGSDIFIHGKAVSIGCLAMGDAAMEELFTLVENVGADNVSVVIAPHDPQQSPLQADLEKWPAWTTELYRDIEAAFLKYNRG